MKKKRIGEKKFTWNPKNKVLYNIMASAPGMIAVNWLFQGMLGMDMTELVFHVLFDVVVFSIFVFVLLLFVNAWIAIILSVFVAHSINWMFNTHFWTIGRYIGISETTEEKVFKYLSQIHKDATKKSYLSGVVVFGNMARGGKIKSTSDVDIRFISKPDIMNRLQTNLFGISQKIRAFFERFPLDLCILDSIKPLDKLREDEVPIILFDPEGILKEKYKFRGYRIFDADAKSRTDC